MTDVSRPPLPYDFLPPVPQLNVTSTDLQDGGTLPQAQVFNGMGLSGGNTSPQLGWSGAPPETKAYAVTCFDPDAPTGMWLLALGPLRHPRRRDRPAVGSRLGRHAGPSPWRVHARNDYGGRDFGGAAPPPGDPAHRYVFAVHAVDTEKLDADADSSPAYVGFNLRFHVQARGLLIATFGR